ncbi:MAG: hypothetical protein CMJ42_14915 [Phyllobacteriaceae bacterium]|nr:hypothetical protein [Phyllobacteriaceae bacterium]
MEKYLRYLKSDIEEAINLAGSQFIKTEAVSFDPDEILDQQIPMRISTITGFEAEVFPPAKMLSRVQLSSLFSHIRRLFEAHSIHWHIPPNVSLRNRYEAARIAFESATILYDPQFGGELDLCELFTEDACPYHGEDGKCTCNQYKSEVNDSFFDYDDEQVSDISSYLPGADYDEPDEPWINPFEDSSSSRKSNATESEESPEEMFLRYFFDIHLDNLGDELDEEDPRINWSDEDDDEIPF